MGRVAHTSPTSDRSGHGDQHPVGHRGAGMVTPRRTAFFRDRPEAADLAGTLGEARAWGKG